MAKYPFEIRYASDNGVTALQILRDTELIQKIPLVDAPTEGTYSVPAMNFDESFRGKQTLVFRAIDKYGYTANYMVHVTFEDRKTDATITIVSPLKESASTRIYGDQFFNLRFTVTPGKEELSSTNIYIDGKLFKILPPDLEQAVAINEDRDGAIGSHTVDIEIVDSKLRKVRKSFSFEIIPR